MSTPEMLSDRYELVEILGYGGMSEVHRGRDVRLGREVAIKVLRADLARDPQFQQRFRKEAQNAAALNHPAIVAVYDTGEADSQSGPLPYIVMEYVEGQTLRDIVKTEGPVSINRAMEIMADVSAALDFSHRHGIVHRDVKPGNVMIDRSGAVKVMDFGIARAVADGNAAVTQTAAVIGTAQYLSPEQARGEDVDARSDVYAAGCVLFELVTGEPPFTGDSAVAVAYQHVREDPLPPSDLAEQVTPEVDAVVLRAMSKNPANRYQSAAELRADLVRVLSGQRPVAPMVMSDAERTSLLGETGTFSEVGEPDPGSQPRRRRGRGWVIAGAVVVLIGLLALGGFLASNLLGSDEPQQVAIPNVIGQQAPVAQQSLERRGLRVERTTVASEEEQKGKVVGTRPEAGTQVDENSTVALRVGGGPEQVEVPNLAGKSRQEAASTLQEAGLRLGPNQETTPVEDESRVGKVVEQNPAAGSGSVDKGSQVNITIGEAIEEVQMINVVGQQVDTATSNLEGLGFRVSTERVDSTSPTDQVIGQQPEQGNTVDSGSEVSLQVSKGNLFEMPDLQGKTQQQAKDALSAAGWTGQLQPRDRQTSNPDEVGTVLDQGTAPGEQIPTDSSIAITLGSKPPQTSAPRSSNPPSSGNPSSSAPPPSQNPTVPPPPNENN